MTKLDAPYQHLYMFMYYIGRQKFLLNFIIKLYFNCKTIIIKISWHSIM